MVNQPNGAFSVVAESMRSELTNEVRAEVVAKTGIDVGPDDTSLAFIELNRILLRGTVKECAVEIRTANEEARQQLEKMREATVKAVTTDLLAIAEQKRESLRLDLKEAEAKAAQIVTGIDTGLHFNKAFWLTAGAIGTALFFFGALIGGSLMRG